MDLTATYRRASLPSAAVPHIFQVKSPSSAATGLRAISTSCPASASGLLKGIAPLTCGHPSPCGLKTKPPLDLDRHRGRRGGGGGREGGREGGGESTSMNMQVLSVQKALSIQAHPDKELAKSLHRRQPQIYKDSNHKPEMALAITHFEALCGFLSAQELKIVVESVPELQYVLGTSLSYDLMNVSISCEKTTKLTLKAAFSAIINANKDLITKSLSQLILRLKSSQQERSLTQRELLILRLAEQYPNDVGIFSALFLNYIRLEPGQALYLSANEPHAYLLGECIECMAASDNVVRAGLTPKYIDTKTLCDMLTYNQGMPEILSGINLNAYTKRYSPPFDEFEMESCMLPIGQRMRLSSIEGPSILIVLGGSGTLHERDGNAQSLQFGDTVFLSAGTEYDVITNPASKGNLQFYRAGVNSRVLLMD